MGRQLCLGTWILGSYLLLVTAMNCSSSTPIKTARDAAGALPDVSPLDHDAPGAGGVVPTGGVSSPGGVAGGGGNGSGGTGPDAAWDHPVADGGSRATGGAMDTGGAAGSDGAQAAGGRLGTGGTVQTGGALATGGNPGGVLTAGSTGTGGLTISGGITSTGGVAITGGIASAGGRVAGGGAPGTGGVGVAIGPCDIYAAANTPCAAAYSMTRLLSSKYGGPLYQVRSGSSSQNTGTGGAITDIGAAADGYADAATQDAFCGGTVCTVSLLYDQSGNGNHLKVAPKGMSGATEYSALDDFESSATKAAVTAGGHRVHGLYMVAREGYRLTAPGRGMPVGTAAQGIYELADGTRVSENGCCWDFGNVLTDPTKYGLSDALFFGVGYWGKGDGSGPWFMADFGNGIWAGGSRPDDGTWGGVAIGEPPPNPANPSMKVPFAFGILKTSPDTYAIRVADAQKATDLTTAYEGGIPITLKNEGGIVLGVGADNSNSGSGTFYEGAITSGYPSNATDLAVLKNVQAVGYAR
jgi:hypothetical protein